MRERVAERRGDELDRGMTLVGPHRDDLVLHLGPAPAKGFASHGESWSLALALKLATFALLRAEGEDPILILDDVFATLDAERRAALAAVARSAEQTLITAAVLDDVPAELRGVRVEVGDGYRGRGEGRRRLRRGEGAVSEERPARPSDIARAALEAARAASAARPQPTRRRIAGPRRTLDRRRARRRRPAAARPAGRLAGHRAGLVGAHPGRARSSAGGRRWSARTSPRTAGRRPSPRASCWSSPSRRRGPPSCG